MKFILKNIPIIFLIKKTIIRKKIKKKINPIINIEINYFHYHNLAINFVLFLVVFVKIYFFFL